MLGENSVLCEVFEKLPPKPPGDRPNPGSPPISLQAHFVSVALTWWITQMGISHLDSPPLRIVTFKVVCVSLWLCPLCCWGKRSWQSTGSWSQGRDQTKTDSQTCQGWSQWNKGDQDVHLQPDQEWELTNEQLLSFSPWGLVKFFISVMLVWQQATVGSTHADYPHHRHTTDTEEGRSSCREVTTASVVWLTCKYSQALWMRPVTCSLSGLCSKPLLWRQLLTVAVRRSSMPVVAATWEPTGEGGRQAEESSLFPALVDPETAWSGRLTKLACEREDFASEYLWHDSRM